MKFLIDKLYIASGGFLHQAGIKGNEQSDFIFCARFEKSDKWENVEWTM